MDKNHRVTIIADEDVRTALNAYADANADDIEIENERSNKDATRLGFELGTVAEIATLVTSAFYFGELGIRLFHWLGGSQSNKIIVQTPLKTVEITKSSELTVDEVLELLKSAYESPD